jgi:hypothetical protein
LSYERLQETVTLVGIAFIRAKRLGLVGGDVSSSWTVFTASDSDWEARSPIGAASRSRAAADAAVAHVTTPTSSAKTTTGILLRRGCNFFL